MQLNVMCNAAYQTPKFTQVSRGALLAHDAASSGRFIFTTATADCLKKAVSSCFLS